MSNLLKGPACTAVTLALLAVVLLTRYQDYLNHLKSYETYGRMDPAEYQDKAHPAITQRQLVNLGFAHQDPEYTPANSYIYFPKEKAPGAVRIGFFGCSFTRGSETAPGHDFPSFLQERFRENGMEHVEIINFGIGSFGTHQAHLLWEYAGRQYDLDYVVFTIFANHAERDTSFVHKDRTYLPIRARYVLRQDGLELKEVLGKNRVEAARLYYRLIPPWQYLRYDRQAPPLLRSLVPPGRKLKANPFYYRKGMSEEAEAHETYARLFKKVPEGRHLIVIVNDDYGRGFIAKGKVPGLAYMKSEAEDYAAEYPYAAPLGHRSALGNKLYADELFAYLTGEPRAVLNLLRFSETPGFKSGQRPGPEPLDRYAGAALAVEGHPVVAFHYKVVSKHFTFESHAPNFKALGVQSLFQISFEKGEFMALPFPLADRTPVTLTFKRGAETFNVPLGYAESEWGVLGRLQFAAPAGADSYRFRGPEWQVKFSRRQALRSLTYKSGKKITEAVILLGDRVILKGKAEGKRKIRFYPARSFFKHWIRLRAGEGQYVNPDTLQSSAGQVELALTRPDGVVEHYPVYFHYERVPFEGMPFERKHPHPIRFEQRASA